jgi:hypothetical protein
MELVPTTLLSVLSRLDRWSCDGSVPEDPQSEEPHQCCGAKNKRRLSSAKIRHTAKQILGGLVFQLCGCLIETIRSEMRELAHLGVLVIKFTCGCMQRIGDISNYRSASFHLMVHYLSKVVPKAGDCIGSRSLELIGGL